MMAAGLQAVSLLWNMDIHLVYWLHGLCLGPGWFPSACRDA